MAATSMEEESALSRRSFPDEIEAEILLWLPVKTLIRFKCACKSWYSLISSPQFQKDHFRRAQTKPPLLLTVHREDRDDRRSDPDGHDFTVHFSAHSNSKEGPLTLVNTFSITLPETFHLPFLLSCLGLICLFQRYGSHPMLVCNPSTHEFISLPPTDGFNASMGFGFAASTHQFKVVRVFYGQNNCECEVFTLGTTHWRKVNNAPCNVHKGNAPFLHQAIHFLPRDNFRGVNDTDCIYVFDIDTEEFRNTIRLPASYYSLGDCKYHNGIMITMGFLRLSTLAGSLCLTFDFGKLKCYLELWILKGYNNAEWVKGYTIDVSPVYPYPSYSFRTHPADNVFDETILLNCLDEVGAKVLGYDSQDGIVRVKKSKEWAATFYMETFYSLKSR